MQRAQALEYPMLEELHKDMYLAILHERHATYPTDRKSVV